MAEEGDVINLKILSPSTEIEGGVFLPNLPASTTIKELRQKIQDAAPSKPATERMRLIYRGRVVANDDDKLVDIFGVESIRESKDQSLHLVLRELPNISSAPSPAPRSSTAPPNPFRPAPGTPQSPLQTNPFRALPQQRPNSQPQVLQPHHHHHPHVHHHHHPHPANPFAPGPPIPLPPHLQQQFAQAIAQNAAQFQAQQMIAQNPAQNPAAGQDATGQSASPSGDNAQGQQAGPRPPGSPGPANMPPSISRTIRQEGVGPNGQRWAVTWNDTNVTIPTNPSQQPMLPRSFPHPPNFAIPGQRTPSPATANLPDQVLTRTRIAMEYARQEMNNVRTLLQPPGGQDTTTSALAAVNPPPWRIDQIRHAVRNLIGGLDNVDRGLASLVADPRMAQNRDFVSLQQDAAELRGAAVDFDRLLDGLREGHANLEATAAQDATSNIPVASGTASATPAPATQTRTQSEFPPELFILSSPQGPVGVLFDQRGTYTTTPMIPTLPFQAFSQQFTANRQLIAGIGRQIAHSSIQIPNQPGASAPAQAQQPATGAQPAADQPQNQPQNQNQPAPAVPEQDRVGLIAGHLWLLFKLACFVYFFAGGGGWYRPVMLGIVAGIVYLAQIGIFETQINLVRRHFEALLPLADRVVQAPNRPPANGQAPQNQRVEPGRNLTPQEAAQRLVNQRQDQRVGWIRETMRSTERAFALFVASLFPGIGERMVRAQEERERAERAAEEERHRLREEDERRQDDGRKKSEEGKSADVLEQARDGSANIGAEASGGVGEGGAGSAGASASRKGKERVVGNVEGTE
ncbi:hypothetical protein K458DRAFT_409512 [Lentithecium fluviatile CBS 122367]|uniref:Ubiquitin-like domain-containing protein n=1 Tax=Lentithecium fluviatile CBS 122367 TaxID=1168545 RepID=A0A6G1IHG8_9PLEO|nr:hypothetical protein K458DRAFT_409512 [Lentithecium fluviatile CBS 122367]